MDETQPILPEHIPRKSYELAAHERFDVLVSDIGPPDGSGIDLMQQLKKDHRIFGIALTGFRMEEDLRRSHDVGSSPWI